MDLSAFDVTDIPASVLEKESAVELFGRHVPLDEFAAACATNSYEVLTRMGKRAERVHLRTGSQERES
jgi:alanine racemase